MGKAIVGLFLLGIVLTIYSACVVASDCDNELEDWLNNRD